MVIFQVRYQKWFTVLLISCFVGLGACASVPQPTATLSQAELAVREAERSDAPQHAALELQSARENLDGAKGAMQNEDYVTARRLAEKALVEAQLAQDKAMAASTREAADDLRKSIESLRDEISRASQKK